MNIQWIRFTTTWIPQIQMNIKLLLFFGMSIPSLMANHWSVILLLEHLPHRCHQFQNSIYLNSWKTKYPSESMNKFYYDAQTQTLYPKLNKRYKDINQIIKDSTIKFELNSRSSVSSWRSFFYEIVYPITIFFNFPNLQMWQSERSIYYS